jgi:HEAT repeat protein
VAALADPSPIIRVTAATATLSLPAEEGVMVLTPLLSDKDPFVRQEVAYALGAFRNRGATPALVERLITDKVDGVRGAAAVALGKIKDEAAVVPLAQVLLTADQPRRRSKKKKTKENEFVLRAAAISLGEIGTRAGVPALIEALSNDSLENDVRREAARALGLIADPAAVPALQAATSGSDPHLSRIAFESLRKITLTTKNPS